MYIPKDYYMICERTGMKYRRSEMVKEWTGLWVHKDVHQPRHPQDFVRGVPDDPSVSPTLPDIVQSVGESELSQNMTIWTVQIVIIALSGLADKDPIGVVMNNGATHWSFIDGDPEVLSDSPLKDSNGDYVLDSNGDYIYATDPDSGYIIQLNSPVSYASDMGNTVYLPSINEEDWT
jgi:hypothetical protein